MELLPTVDPIPLPAPVWLLKTLLLLTLTLHFIAVHVLIGGLLLGTVWALVGLRGDARSTPRQAAHQIARRLPVVMAFVINLGVPPLLFTQVLYGQALYTSSVLIGLLWIGVILLLVALYSLLYTSERRCAEGRSYWWASLISTGLAVTIALVYVSNMTLMLRPDAWLEMYRADALGAHLPSGDATIWPRWSYMIVASAMVGGLAVALMGTTTPDARLGGYLQRWGALVGAAGAIVLAPIALWVLATQPSAVTEALEAASVYRYAQRTWYALMAATVLLGAYASRRATARGQWATGLAAVAASLQVALWVVLRDGIRDTSLDAFGYRVGGLRVYTNWSVVGLFVGVLLVGLVSVWWLVRVMLRAEGEHRGHGGGTGRESGAA